MPLGGVRAGLLSVLKGEGSLGEEVSCKAWALPTSFTTIMTYFSPPTIWFSSRATKSM